MLDLSDVTLVCLDVLQPQLALAALEQTMLRCRFRHTLFCTDRAPDIEGLQVVPPPAPGAVSLLRPEVARMLATRIDAPHALLIGWDAFVVNPAAWDPAFLDFDLVLAPSPADEEARGWRGGRIALVSGRLLHALADSRLAGGEALSDLMRPPRRELLESGFGLRFAPDALAERLAFGAAPPEGQPFGFEGLFNMWMFFQPQDLRAFLSMATPRVLGSAEAASLAANLESVGRVDDAVAVHRAIAAAHPGNEQARAALARLQPPGPGQGVRTAPGRNDPCPCGSGQRYKQCHGRLGGPPLPAFAAPPLGATPALPVPAPAGPIGKPVPAPAGPDAQPPAAPRSAARPYGEIAALLSAARAAFDRGDMAAAATAYRGVLERAPGEPVALEYLGVIATQERRFGEADALLTQALSRKPAAPEYHNNLGLLRQAQGDFVAAESAYRAAIARAPGYAPAHNNLGLALQEQGRVAEAIASFRLAVRHHADFAEAHWNLALALLLAGEFAEGWIEQEWRLKIPRHRQWWARRQSFPQWTGQDLAGRRLLILMEQGMGDMIQFVRYAEALAARGASVLVEAPPDLADLLRGVAGVGGIVPRDGPFPPCDYQVPVLSLPLGFGTRLETIPAPPAYLRADPARRERWRGLLGPRTRPRVGLAWAGNPDHVRDAFRSLHLRALAAMLDAGEFEWIGLQKGEPAAQIATLPPDRAPRDLARESRNFADLAALISELDAVVTVDTSVVHLAGALGMPTMLLLDTAHDWRWLQRRTDSPWYPGVRVFRQEIRGDWSAPVAGALAALRERLLR